MSTLKLTTNQWQQIRADLDTEHPKTVFMLRGKMKRVLGFTFREHQEWVKVEYNMGKLFGNPIPAGLSSHGGRLEYSIRLDFYNERKYTMFILKYSEILHGR